MILVQPSLLVHMPLLAYAPDLGIEMHTIRMFLTLELRDRIMCVRKGACVMCIPVFDTRQQGWTCLASQEIAVRPASPIVGAV